MEAGVLVLKLDFCLEPSITSENSCVHSDKNKEQRYSVCKSRPTGKSAGNSLGLCSLPVLHSAGSEGHKLSRDGRREWACHHAQVPWVPSV